MKNLFFLFFESLTLIFAFPTESHSPRHGLLKPPLNKETAPKLDFLDNIPGSPPTNEDWDLVINVLRSDSESPAVPQNLPSGQTLERPFQLQPRGTGSQRKFDFEVSSVPRNLPEDQILKHLRQRKTQMAEELQKLYTEFLALSSATFSNPGLRRKLDSEVSSIPQNHPEVQMLKHLHQKQTQIAEELGKLYADYFLVLSSAAFTNAGLQRKLGSEVSSIPQNHPEVQMLKHLHQKQTQIAEELGKLYADYFLLLSSAALTNPSVSRTEANPLRRIHRATVPGNPHLEALYLNFKNFLRNIDISQEETMKSVLHNHARDLGSINKATNPLKNVEANPFSAIHEGEVSNPLLDSRKFENDPLNVKAANPFPGVQREKVPDHLSLDERLTQEVMDIYEDFVSHQSSIGDEKHTNSVMNAKEANPSPEKVFISHFSVGVPQNSRNHLKRKEGGGSLHVLEDVRKTQSKIDISNSIENHPTLVRPLSHTLQTSNQPFDGPARKIFGDSSTSLSKAISRDSSEGEEAAAEIFSKLPRFLK